MKLFVLKKIPKMPPPPKKVSAHAAAEWINVALKALQNIEFPRSNLSNILDVCVSVFQVRIKML